MKSKTYNKNKETVFAACLKVLEKLKFNIELKDIEQGAIFASKAGVQPQYKHTFEININPILNRSTVVIVSSASNNISSVSNDINANLETSFHDMLDLLLK